MLRVHPIGGGKGKSLKLFSVEGFGCFLFGLCYFVGFGFEGLWGLGWRAWIFCSFWSLLYSGAPFSFNKLLFIKKKEERIWIYNWLNLFIFIFYCLS
jgi:hypothetical protein